MNLKYGSIKVHSDMLVVTAPIKGKRRVNNILCETLLHQCIVFEKDTVVFDTSWDSYLEPLLEFIEVFSRTPIHLIIETKFDIDEYMANVGALTIKRGDESILSDEEKLSSDAMQFLGSAAMDYIIGKDFILVTERGTKQEKIYQIIVGRGDE